MAENFDTLPKPYRSYRSGFVFRNEKPGPGRFRQFMQFDADTVGSASPAADAEMCMMAADTMEALGIPRGSYVVKVNNRKVLDGVLEEIGLDGEVNAGTRLTVMRAIDKLDRLGEAGVSLLLTRGRKDECGDFTKGAGLIATRTTGKVLKYVRRVMAVPTRRRQRRSWPGIGFAHRATGGGSASSIRSPVLACFRRLRRRPDPGRSIRGARPRILHRPGLRG